jgi:serine/threonine-protein kinase OSR1/STK39
MQVFRALCLPRGGEVVAVKRTVLENATPEGLATLAREPHCMRRLAHPNILPLHASFVHGQELWMVSPFCVGGSARHILQARLKRVRPRPSRGARDS